MSKDKDITHFGVRGMRWGVRNETSTPVSKEPSPVVVVTKKGTSKISTTGGERHPASEDAKRVAASRQKLKKSGMSSLSNKEMQDLVTRLNLERQLSTVTTQEKSKFQKNAEEVLQNVMKKQMANLINTGLNSAFKTAMESAKKKK